MQYRWRARRASNRNGGELSEELGDLRAFYLDRDLGSHDAENPYVLNIDLLNALVRARLRGVDVRVVMPSENDLSAGRKSNLVTANYLRENGVRVYLYPGMTHVKAMVIDGWACFGSANFDVLSLRFLLEADLATSDPAFAREFRQQLFETDFARSREAKEPLPVGWGDYLADALLAPF